MKCPSCEHVNVSDFPFCENCLELLPARPGNELAFELDIASIEEPEETVGWPPFPWNPKGLQNRLVGRDGSLNELLAAWDTTVAGWTGRLHLLVSEFGMGKSQLTSRLAREVIRREPMARVIRIRCPERGGPYRMWDAVMRSLFEIPETDGPAEAGARLLAGVGEYLNDEVNEVASVIGDLLGYHIPGHTAAKATEGEAIVGRGAGALSRLLTAVASEPLLLIISQANRGSASSLALAGALEASLKDRPAMMVLTGTPELSRILSGWERFPVTRLEPLPKKFSQEIVRLFLEGLKNVPEELVSRIVERAQGNPWAAKSMLHYLGEAGAIRVSDAEYLVDESVCWDLEWPEDLEGVVLARLSMLSARDRAVLGNAAVVGRTFWTGALVAIERRDEDAMEQPGETVRDNLSWSLGRSLERLAALRFITRQTSGLRGEDTWLFRSTLHHKVASTIVPEATRKRLHAVIEQWLRLHAEPTGNYLIELARHAELAGAKARAVRYNLRAGRNALKDHQAEEAEVRLAQAQALVQIDDAPTQISISLDLGDARTILGNLDGALASYQQALHLCWRLRHRIRGADSLVRIGKVETTAGRYERAAKNLEAALRLYEERNEQRGVADVCLHLGKVYWLKGKHGEALQSYRKAESVYGELENQSGLGEVFDALASLHYDRGDLRQAETFYRRAIQRRNAIDDPRGVAAGLCNLGATWMHGGQTKRAITAWEEALELAALVGSAPLKVALAGNLGEAHLKLGQTDKAAEFFDQGLQAAENGGAEPRSMASIRLNRAIMLMQNEKWGPAVAELELARAVCEELQIPRLSGHVERTTGELFLARHQGSADGAQGKLLRSAIRHFRVSTTDFIEAGCNLEAASTHDRLAEALELSGKPDDAALERTAADELRGAHSDENEVKKTSLLPETPEELEIHRDS